MSALPGKPQIRLRRNVRPTRGGTGVFAALTAAAEQLWDVLWPAIRIVADPVIRVATHRITIGGSECNPLRRDACYWGRGAYRELFHGLTWSFLMQAGLIIGVTVFLLVGFHGCDEYLLPAGGGKNAVMAKRIQVPKIKKVIKRKFVVNPNSPIKFEVPDIEKVMEVKITQVLEAGAAHTYAVGQLGSGTGEGAGYGAGHKEGLIRLIRLKYSGGDWNSNFGKGADNNMLLEYKVRSGQKTANESEAITIDWLNAYRKYRAPPLVYLTGSGKMDISDKEVATIRKYLTDQHGMLFADAASPGWARNFKGLMTRVLPDVKPVHIPIDDPVLRMPYTLTSVPYASPHDPPMELTGWKIGGRWVAVYHPGDIGDCWKDGHSGVSTDTADAAYQLGLNVIHYAHAQYSEWVTSQTGGKQ